MCKTYDVNKHTFYIYIILFHILDFNPSAIKVQIYWKKIADFQTYLMHIKIFQLIFTYIPRTPIKFVLFVYEYNLVHGLLLKKYFQKTSIHTKLNLQRAWCKCIKQQYYKNHYFRQIKLIYIRSNLPHTTLNK